MRLYGVVTAVFAPLCSNQLVLVVGYARKTTEHEGLDRQIAGAAGVFLFPTHSQSQCNAHFDIQFLLGLGLTVGWTNPSS